MAQTLAVVAIAVLPIAAVIVRSWWKPRPRENLLGPPRSRSVGDLIARGGGTSLPIEEFADWRMHYFRILASARGTSVRRIPNLDQAGIRQDRNQQVN